MNQQINSVDITMDPYFGFTKVLPINGSLKKITENPKITIIVCSKVRLSLSIFK